MKKLILSLTVLALVAACDKKETPNNTTEQTTSETMETPNYKDVAEKAQAALFKDYDAQAVKEYFKDSYIQHNPGVPTGLEPIVGFLPALKEAGTTYTTHRILQDGDLIVTHNTYTNAQPFGAERLVGFDVWRMEDGKVAEHWDNLTPVTEANPSGRTQTDGETTITDLDKTAENKKIVENFVNEVLLEGKMDNLTTFINPQDYKQHNSAVADGLEGFGEAMKYFAENGLVMEYEKLHKVIGEGNFVLAMSEGKFGKGEHVAFYDLFRLQDGQIVEHWDVIQEIPTEMAHENGKF